MVDSTSQHDGTNPFIGPRAFNFGETLYGRDREAARLTNLMITDRIVLLHSPSGAGKTSLVQAALVPELKRNKFFVHTVLRLNNQAPPDWNVLKDVNIYTTSVLLSLEKDIQEEKIDELKNTAGWDLNHVFDAIRKDDGDSNFEVLIFDQFEEIFTIDPTDRDARLEFFYQLGELLHNRRRWALFSMREEYVAALRPYLRPIPTHLSTQFHLELLGSEAARKAIMKPSEGKHGEFTESAARKLVNDLRKVRVQRLDGSTEWRPGPYVEPVQLQVVCRRMWDKRPKDKAKITEADIGEFENVDEALKGYYAASVVEVAEETGVDERRIRRWFGTALITREGIRTRVLKAPEHSQDLANSAIRSLVDTHLVREEESHYRTWFELAHDRLVGPIREDNEAWGTANLSRWQKQATLWADQGQPESLLLEARDVQEAERWVASDDVDVTDNENLYIQRSKSKILTDKRERRQKHSFAILGVIIALVVIAGATYYYQSIRAILPWGYLIDLKSGNAHLLSEGQATLGRSTEYKNTINVPDKYRYVSRIHFLISRDRDQSTGFDMRSMNGTTINANFLSYGESTKIANRDIIALAGMAAFQLHYISYPFYQFWKPKVRDDKPADGFILFIDGKNKQATPLSNYPYFLNMDNKGATFLDSEKGEKTLLSIALDKDYFVKIFDYQDEFPLTFQVKGSDYNYPETIVNAEQWTSIQSISWADRYGNAQGGRYFIVQGVLSYRDIGLSFQFAP